MTALATPIQIGTMPLSNRIVLAPLTRYRASASHVPALPIVRTYYTHRASTPGTLLITEATQIAPAAGGTTHAPGIYTAAQIEAWAEVTRGVHDAGGYVFCQLWAMGRAARVAELEGCAYVSASAIGLKGREDVPRALEEEEVREYVRVFGEAARKAVEGAGFDGIEIHGANGYLVDQFLQDCTNTRTDVYGGSVENRCRFALEVIGAAVDAVGAEKVAIRLSPWSTFQDMRMKDPLPTFLHLLAEIKCRFPRLAYIHVVESTEPGEEAFNDPLREAWGSDNYIAAGGFGPRLGAWEEKETEGERVKREERVERAAQRGLVAFGKVFLSNPDLVHRLISPEDIPLNPYDFDTFYVKGDTVGKGYIDYPFWEAEGEVNV